MKKRTAIHLNIEEGLHRGLLALAKKNGVSMNFVIRRALIHTISTGVVNWPLEDDLEAREHKKFGAATPLYDVESESSRGGSKSPSSRAQ